MIIKLSMPELQKLKTAFDADADCEALNTVEYVCDFFEPTPVTANIVFKQDAIEIIAAAKLLYSEEDEGWYMGEHIEDENALTQIIKGYLNEQ